MVGGGFLEQYGLFGLLLLLLANLAYTAYENRYGVVNTVRKRLDAMAVLQYKTSKELDTIDEDAARHQLFNGGEVTFPSDYEKTTTDCDDGDDTDTRPQRVHRHPRQD